MRRWIGALGALALPTALAGQVKSVDRQVLEAISPLPVTMRHGATVFGYEDGELVKLRAGSGPMICLADDPLQPGFQAACYHESLEPFMARGRELRARGLNRTQVEAMRQAEIEAGALMMPERPAALYTLNGDEGSFVAESGTVRGGRELYVLYVPYATEASTGVSTRPSGNSPWLMAPGTPWAHIMISR